ncbi:hypothetical protein [Hymenobacter rubripertinctus]|uniref:hypothetical protein n=1 Tax=Hymenobacter rubripertinctus TaxID=2029981 RepID=UPI0011C4874B|nr:hypothetical protein [Hymenobacter rubripertinctus]
MAADQDWDVEGPEFGAWLEQWGYLEEEEIVPSLYRLQTKPEVPGLHGQLVSDLCREWPEGIFLQLVESRPGQIPAATTWLVYLDFTTLQWERLTETADYYLLPNAAGAEHGLFEGLSLTQGRLELRVQMPG